MIKEAANGSLGLAPFQRQYVWTKEDVEKLMKSILNKWPVGSLTTWTPSSGERGQFPTKGRLGPVEHPGAVETLVLDGQNRLASLIYAPLLHKAPIDPAYPYSQQEIDVWFGDKILVADFATKSVTFRPRDQAWSATAAPFGDLMDAMVFSRARQFEVLTSAQGRGMDERTMQWLLNDVPGLVRSARITTTNLLDATIEQARECYMTICRAGQPISDEEFDMAFSYTNPVAQTPNGPRP